ncbi:hypothetical protein B566_EDAN007944 [Ephemera danica]|nr:hypothetical protein B566_EDAN007944 [Ephemera danica]
MASTTLIYTIFYILMTICFVFPPTEFVSSGFTIESIFANWLGSEDLHFVQYHIRRSVATLALHSLIPFGYIFGLSHFSSVNVANMFLKGTYIWKIAIALSIICPLIVFLYIKRWSKHQWREHPIAQTLALYCTPQQSWIAVATDINVEFRRIDKICIQTSSVIKIIATDHWLIKVSPYTMKVAHQSDVALCLLSSDTHTVSPDNPGGAQFLNLEVKSVRRGISPFQLRLNAFHFKDLQDKILQPIANIGNVTFPRTLSDRFLEAFQEQVEKNIVYTTNEELEPCIGCMQNTSNIKLQKLCGTGADFCQTCFCRPMWCLYCMGKWFASRQDQAEPETWLGSDCPCPTCRSKFCMLDVCLVQQSD